MSSEVAGFTSERIAALDTARVSGGRFTDAHIAPPDADAAPDYDVVFAGGGLSLAIAPRLARAGLRVAVFERQTAGVSHREWNAARDELEQLVRGGLLTAAELTELIVARYESGVCRWFGGGAHSVRGVLDHAVDAGALLGRIRFKAEQSGVEFFDGHLVVGERARAGRVLLRVRDSSGHTREVMARALVDARGVSSPYASADLVCPTVGGVLTGLDIGDAPTQVNPAVGDILATTEHVEDGRQHVWEAFPGRAGEVTVYLFYYARSRDVGQGALGRLYQRFFETLPRFKSGEATLLRPTFGYIPGWSRLSPPPRSPAPNLFLVGDAAARHSPLTYCGFGHMLRTFDATARSVERFCNAGASVLTHDGEGREREALHSGTGALSLMMASPPLAPERAGELNALLDAAFATLAEMGDARYRALLRDELHPRDLIDFLRRTAARHPAVYRRVVAQLGPGTVTRWGAQLLRATWRSDRPGGAIAPAEAS